MFLKKVTLKTEGKTYDYYKIVASYRDKDGNPKHRLIQNIGVLSNEDADRIRLILKAQQDPDLSFAKCSDIVVSKHWTFLPILVLHALWDFFQLQRFFPGDFLTEAMVLNRCLEPRSKIHVLDWVQDTVLPAICRYPNLKSNYAVYRELDDLNKRESELQSHLYQQLQHFDPSIGEGFFYDITSSYMEGCKCVIAKFGYSRDHRPDLQQIVIALMVTPLGSPFYWKVLEGNTQDVTTLPDVVKDLQKRFGLSSCHLVFDRGMVSDDHLSFLEQEKLTYLSAMDKDEMAGHPLFNEFMPEAASREDYEQILALREFQATDENQLFYTREGRIGQRRYIFGFDLVRFYEDIDFRAKRMRQAVDWIKEKNQSLALAKKSRNEKTLEREVKTMLSKRKLKSLLTITITPIELEVAKSNGGTRIVKSFKLSMEIDKEKEEQKRKMDGITCFITNDLSIAKDEVIKKYREKNKIEEAFREMKSQLALRPIYLTRPERVKAHVSICILAYLLINTIEMILKKANIDLSSEELLRQMNSCRLNKVGLKSSTQTTLCITEMNDQQKQWVKLFQCEKMIKPKAIKQFTEYFCQETIL